ncbi:MAG: hypothetical protein M3O15_13475 [Acidobacteriota bacterium]|nr:hypothetical protein [Acidobacteriota bacterium]
MVLASRSLRARKYLRELDENRLQIREELGNRSIGVGTYRSTVMIVAGRSPIDQGALEALRDMNVDNPRILLVTYDELLASAEATITIIERRVSTER